MMDFSNILFHSISSFWFFSFRVYMLLDFGENVLNFLLTF